MVEYLPRSGTNCLGFQANDEQNRKLGTPVEINNLSLPPTANTPHPFEDTATTTTEESLPDSVSVSVTE